MSDELNFLESENKENFDFSKSENCAFKLLDFRKEVAKIESQIALGDIDIVEAGKLIYKAYKTLEKAWKNIQEEVYDECDSKYQKQELTEMGITLRSASRPDAKSYQLDGEWNLAKQALKSREELMKQAYKHVQSTGEDYIVGDEIITPCTYLKGSKSVSFKL